MTSLTNRSTSNCYFDYYDQNNLVKTNEMRSYLKSDGYDFKQLCKKGVSLQDLEDLFFYDCKIARAKITRKKRHIMAMYLQMVVDYLDLSKG